MLTKEKYMKHDEPKKSGIFPTSTQVSNRTTIFIAEEDPTTYGWKICVSNRFVRDI